MTVQEFTEISRVYKQQMVDAWCRVKRSASSPDSQQAEDVLLQLIPSDMRFYAEKSRFWEEQIPRVEALLKNVSECGGTIASISRRSGFLHMESNAPSSKQLIGVLVVF